MPFFNDVSQLPVDPILGLPIAFAADPRPFKVNLGIGAYRTSEGLPLLMTSVRKAESIIQQKHLSKEYLPIEGDGEFLSHSLQLLFGIDSFFLNSGCYFAAQAVGGTSALRTAAEFLGRLISKTIFISQPTWSNHKQIFERAGLNVGSYPYFDPKTRLLDFDGMCEAIRNMPPASVLLLHGCCHNPTGIDPTFEQWKELSLLIKKQQVIPLFDIAYQGFGQSLDEDAKAIRYFAQEGHEMLAAYSFAKNCGLYGERIGFLTLSCANKTLVPKIGSQIKQIIRANYSNPPLHGERIVTTILKSLELSQEWKAELNNMRERVKEMRNALLAELLVQRQDFDYSFLSHQKGLFSYSGFTPEQVLKLREEKAVYMPNNGRINIAGLNTQNLPYVAEALLSVM